jgi:hypothetical protein
VVQQHQPRLIVRETSQLEQAQVAKVKMLVDYRDVSWIRNVCDCQNLAKGCLNVVLADRNLGQKDARHGSSRLVCSKPQHLYSKAEGSRSDCKRLHFQVLEQRNWQGVVDREEKLPGSRSPCLAWEQRCDVRDGRYRGQAETQRRRQMALTAGSLAGELLVFLRGRDGRGLLKAGKPVIEARPCWLRQV